ncbi:MAG TPA: sigma-70 family RNA polymerase sigma factor [Candidatus Polarisedimenticolia bacterium]|nr:sigma-70 family RNA polymerase sigma factor [Candidatus Polarisedimenticolia bacterium]
MDRAVAYVIADHFEERRELVARHLPFVRSVAARYRHRGLPIEDLVGEGSLGLLEAARLYDPTRGVKFVSYAVYWIRRAIMRALEAQRSIAHVPHHLRRLGVHGGASVPLSAPILPGSTLLVADTLVSETDEGPALQFERRDAHERLQRALARLTPRERLVLAHRFGLEGREPEALQAIGGRLGVTREAVRQIEKRALHRLRRTVNVSGLRSASRRASPAARPVRSMPRRVPSAHAPVAGAPVSGAPISHAPLSLARSARAR